MGFFDDVVEWLTGGTRPYTDDGSGDDVSYGGGDVYGGMSHADWEEMNDAMDDCTDGCCTGEDDES